VVFLPGDCFYRHTLWIGLVVYRLAVVAFDGGQPARTASLVVDVNVRDFNDNAPRFAGNATFIADVDENVPVGAVIATLRLN